MEGRESAALTVIPGNGELGGGENDEAHGKLKERRGEPARERTREISPRKLKKMRVRDERYKAYLLQDLSAAGWKDEEVAELGVLLLDPRVTFLPGVLEINMTHVETAEQYKQHLTPEALSAVRDYWTLNREAILSGIREGSVPASVVLGILKVETNLGNYPGLHSVFNVFWSLALADRPEVLKGVLGRTANRNQEEKRKLFRRAIWARNQLRDLLFMAKHGGEDPVGIMGSWAGAFGLCQFIPGSYRAYGRDGNGDGIIDLDDIADASASIVYYLAENGWPPDSAGEDSEALKKRSIMRYNHSEYYADCVLAIAERLEAEDEEMAVLP